MTTSVSQIDIPAGTWTLDKAHTALSFVARHMMVTRVRGTFRSFDGRIDIAEDPTESKVTINIETGSVSTGADDRDAHLVSPDFFDAGTFPTMKFVSTDIHQKNGQWRLTGDLTIKNITRPVTLDVSFEGSETNPWGKTIAAFTATAEVDREAWGLTWNVPLESGGLLVGRKVKLEIEAQLHRD